MDNGNTMSLFPVLANCYIYTISKTSGKMGRKTACSIEGWHRAAGTLFRTLAEEARRKGYRLDLEKWRELRRKGLEELAEALRNDCSDPESIARRIAERLI